MKKILWILATLSVLILAAGVFLIVLWYKIIACEVDQSGVFVEHVWMCAERGVDNEEPYEFAYLNEEQKCDSEGEVCWVEFTDKNGKVLELPSEVSDHLTPSKMYSFSPHLLRVVYRTMKDGVVYLEVYNLKNEEYETLYTPFEDNQGFSDYQWESDYRFLVTSIENDMATRFTFEWSEEESWELVGEEVLKGEIECNSEYCEFDEAPSEQELKCQEDLSYCEWY